MDPQQLDRVLTARRELDIIRERLNAMRDETETRPGHPVYHRLWLATCLIAEAEGELATLAQENGA